jgi:hypothetical protein
LKAGTEIGSVMTMRDVEDAKYFRNFKFEIGKSLQFKAVIISLKGYVGDREF